MPRTILSHDLSKWRPLGLCKETVEESNSRSVNYVNSDGAQGIRNLSNYYRQLLGYIWRSNGGRLNIGALFIVSYLFSYALQNEYRATGDLYSLTISIIESIYQLYVNSHNASLAFAWRRHTELEYVVLGDSYEMSPKSYWS